MLFLLGGFRPPELGVVSLTPNPGTPPVTFTINWTVTGITSNWFIDIEAYEFPGGPLAFNVAGLNPLALSYAGDCSSWLNFNPSVGLDGYEIRVRLRNLAFANAPGSPQTLFPPF